MGTFNSNDKYGTILNALTSRDDVTAFRFTISDNYIEKYNLTIGATFCLKAATTSFEFSIGLNSEFPFSLPDIFMTDLSFYGQLPHVEKNGWICYYSKEGLTIDYERPKDIINNALDLVIENVLSLNDKEKETELINEFESYWNRLEPSLQAISLVKLENKIKEVVKLKKKNTLIYCDNESQLDSYHNKSVDRDFTIENVIYIPLNGSKFDLPFDESFWSLQEIKKLVYKNLSTSTYDELGKFLKKKRLSNTEVVLLSIPRENKEDIFIGIEFQYTSIEHPLLPSGQAHKIKPIILRRVDSDFLLKRSSSNIDIRDKKVLIIGLGSIGGFISSGLVESGVKNLTLIDFDKFEKGNLYRHLLGKNYFGKKKVVAIKGLLEKSYPNLNINTYQKSAIHTIQNGEIKLSEYDLVIVSVGNPITEFKLNEIFKDHYLSKVIFTWLEPLDIGGHLLKLDYTDVGCYKCLYDFEHNGDVLELVNMASFFAPGQSFEKDMEGCGTAFTPYGSNSAKKTANLVVENAIKLLKNKSSIPQLISWKGDNDQAHENNFKLAKRYSLSSENLEAGGKTFQRYNCDVCNEQK